ncbi:MAG: LysM peptidoglycan-binding domain-containing protein [Bacilli bacterium]|nr:LysM peptidoglycan-binding domain-containing protein [Bacilli bacterium]
MNYIVEKGDTLYGIAKKFNTSVQKIKELNNLSTNNISIGQSLKVLENSDKEPMECIVYTVKKGDSLYAIAKKYNTTVDEIKRYNNLKTNLLNIGDRIVIPCNVEYDYDSFENNYVDYIVVKGDTLYSIANKFGTTVDNIKSLNDLNNNNLTIGMKLIVDDKKNVSPVLECFGESNYENNNYINYTVVKNDNLYDLARKYDTSVETIKRLNNLTTNNLSIGQILKIPKDKENNYIVQKGESLYSIAKKFNTTVDDLKKKNNLATNLISVGQELKV